MKKYLLIIAVAAFAACSKDGGGTLDNPRKYIDMTQTYEELSAGSSDFAFKLFAAMDAEDGSTAPITLSPLSLSISLGMLGNGAAGSTLDEILTVIGAEGYGLGNLNDYYRTLIGEMPGLDKTTTLKVASSQWVNPSFTILPSYTTALSDYYDAETYTLDFSSAKSDINGWCSRKTEGLITDFIEDEVSPDTQMMLLNAIYFKGVWKDKFDRSDTQTKLFTNGDGSFSTASYMTQELDLAPYHSGDGYSALTLRFGNAAYSMQILLPDEGVSLSDCIASLGTEEWLKWDQSGSCSVDLWLPKFSVQYKEHLQSFLEQLGVKSAFEGGDYSNMSADEVWIDDVLQETMFTIDEDGAEAATVTGMKGYTADIRKHVEFHVTRPFLYLVKENSSDTILFMGRIAKF